MRRDVGKLIEFPINACDILSHTINLFAFGFRGLPRLVYKDMYDYCRRVTDDVVIGAATRLGKPIGQYFVLARG